MCTFPNIASLTSNIDDDVSQVDSVEVFDLISREVVI